MINEASSLEEGKILVSNKIINFQQSIISSKLSLTGFIFSFFSALLGLFFTQSVVKMVIDNISITAIIYKTISIYVSLIGTTMILVHNAKSSPT